MRFHKLLSSISDQVGKGFIGDFRRDIDWLHQSQKFYLGDLAVFPESDSFWQQYPRLPYPTCAFELEIGFGSEKKRRYIVLAVERDGVLAFSCWESFDSDGALWISLGCIEIDRAACPRSRGWLDSCFGGDRSLGQKLLDRSLAVVASMAGAIEAMNLCQNIKRDDVLPSKALNAKRIKSGKPPIYAYKVLVLHRGKAAQRLGGTHASPRVHLVRGHIKRRKSGNFWWQPHARGDKSRGVVMKDYRADRLMDEISPPDEDTSAAAQRQVDELKQGFADMLRALKSVRGEILERRQRPVSIELKGTWRRRDDGSDTE